jgi:hypothetical protein
MSTVKNIIASIVGGLFVLATDGAGAADQKDCDNKVPTRPDYLEVGGSWWLQQKSRLQSVASNSARSRHDMASKLFGDAIHKQIGHDLTGAIADYSAALALDDNPAVHWYLGTAYLAAGEAAKAKLEFKREKIIQKRNSTNVEIMKSEAYKASYGTRLGSHSSNTGDFGSTRLFFVPGEGLTQYGGPRVK